jgi:hypothetical protein
VGKWVGTNCAAIHGYLCEKRLQVQRLQTGGFPRCGFEVQAQLFERDAGGGQVEEQAGQRLLRPPVNAVGQKEARSRSPDLS